MVYVIASHNKDSARGMDKSNHGLASAMVSNCVSCQHGL